MGFGSFIRKQFIDIIEWTESADNVLAWRFPTADREIQYGGSLTVRESQAAVFVNEGKVADVFGPGMHKLTTQTMPVLTYLKNWDKLFESPFKSEVYFFSLRSRLGRKWGTPQLVTIRDKDFGAIQLRAFGQYAYHIADPKTFFSGVSGSLEEYTVERLEEQLRGVIVAGLVSAIGASGIPFLDLAGNQEEMAKLVRAAMAERFAALGLALDDFQLISVTLPDALQEALNRRISVGMMADRVGTYTALNAAEAIPLAAANEGGGMAGMAAQMAVGLGMGQVMQQTLGQAFGPGGAAQPGASVAPGAAPAQAPAQADTPQARLAQLKAMLDQGLIAQTEYDEAKRAIMAKLVG